MASSFSKITPHIWLDDQAEQAAAFYVRIFPAGRIVATSRYPESIDTPGGWPRGSVLTVEFEVAGQLFIALCLMCAGTQHGKAEEAMRFYAGIFPGGRVECIERYAAGRSSPCWT